MWRSLSVENNPPQKLFQRCFFLLLPSLFSLLSFSCKIVKFGYESWTELSAVSTENAFMVYLEPVKRVRWTLKQMRSFRFFCDNFSISFRGVSTLETSAIAVELITFQDTTMWVSGSSNGRWSHCVIIVWKSSYLLTYLLTYLLAS